MKSYKPHRRDAEVAAVLFEESRNFQHLLGSSTDPVVFRQVHPAHRPGSIDQKLGGSRDVMAILTRARMDQVITPDYLRIRIRKKGKTVTSLLRKAA